MALPSVMQHSFSQVPKAEIPRSAFDRSHGYKTTFDAGYLIPFFVDEALPADTFSLTVNAFARLATPIKPIMDNLHMDFFFFSIPLRLVWNNWQKFNGEQTNPGDSTSFVMPVFSNHTVGFLSLSDYMGLPVNIANTSYVSVFHRAYNLTWNHWFRDQNLQNSVTVDMGDGPDNISNYVLLRRGKRPDYFTSALPWPQKGTAVSMPLGTQAPIVGLGINTAAPAAANASVYGYTSAQDWTAQPSWTSNVTLRAQSNAVPGVGNRPQVYADLSTATPA